MTHPSYRKGYRFENELTKLHRALGVDIKRIPLSGGAEDEPIDHEMRIPGIDRVWSTEAKRRKKGWKGIYDLLSKGVDVLFLRADREKMFVVLTHRAYVELLTRDGR